MQKSLAVLIIVVAAGQAVGREVKPALSLRYSCFEKPFLSVSMYVLPHRDIFPDVELRLIDPRGRALGSAKQRRVLKFRSGKVIEIAKQPTRSKAVAAEVCGAMQGDYSLVVSEHENGQYRIAVRADDGGTGNESMTAGVLTRRGRTCTYPFRVLMSDHSVSVKWLGSTDHVQTFLPDPSCTE
jgi:hypothetical protein